MTWRAIKSVLVVVACWATVNHLDDVARWLHMRDLSNPDRYPPAPGTVRPGATSHDA